MDSFGCPFILGASGSFKFMVLCKYRDQGRAYTRRIYPPSSAVLMPITMNWIEIVSREIDPKAIFFTELVQTTRAKLAVYARSRKVAADVIEDLVQEACFSAWRNIDKVMGSPNPQGWLMNAMKLHIRRYHANLAKGGKLADMLIADPGSKQHITDDDSGEISFAAVLTADEMRIAALREQGYNDREIADMTNTEYSAIRKRFSRIREKIKKFMG
jgi:RNA polymerase sigma-70 factor (ECF subfamily)